MSQVRFGISQVEFGTWLIWDLDHPKLKFRFGMCEIELPIWDIPGITWDMVEFGLQHQYQFQFHDDKYSQVYIGNQYILDQLIFYKIQMPSVHFYQLPFLI